MVCGTVTPGTYDDILGPLPSYIQADIQLLDRIVGKNGGHEARLAFNRLVAELHVVSISLSQELTSRELYQSELSQIDKLLSAIDIPHAATVDRVSTLVGRVVQARDSMLRTAAALEGRKV